MKRRPCLSTSSEEKIYIYYNAESYEDQSHLFDESQFYEPEPQLKALKRQLFVLSIKSLLVFLSHRSVSATQASQRPKPHTRASQPWGTLTSLSIEYPVHCSSLARCLVFLLCQILRVVAPAYIGCTPSSAWGVLLASIGIDVTNMRFRPSLAAQAKFGGANRRRPLNLPLQPPLQKALQIASESHGQNL